MYYNHNELNTHNGFINIIFGGRGIGKTFDFKNWAINDSNGATVWIRRHDNVFSQRFYNGFAKDLINEGRIDGELVKIESGILRYGENAKIYFIPLSLQQKFKSINFSDVNKVVFDEFAEMKYWKYLPNEVNEFLELIETINRLRPKGKEVRVYMLANKVSWINPYTKAWNITPFTSHFKHFKNGLVVVENFNDPDFKEAKKQTKFGQLIDGTEYGDYAIDNAAWQDDNAFIAARPPRCECWVNLRIENRRIGIWLSQDHKLYCSNKTDVSKKTFAMREDLQEGERALLSSHEPVTSIKEYSAAGKLFFENNVIKSDIFEIMLNTFS